MSRGGEQLKVSEVAGLIDQIEVGGGGNIPFTIDSVTFNDQEIGDENTEFDYSFSRAFTVNIKISNIKKDYRMYDFILHVSDGPDTIVAKKRFYASTDTQEVKIQMKDYNSGEYNVFDLFLISSEDYKLCQLIKKFKLWNDEYY